MATGSVPYPQFLLLRHYLIDKGQRFRVYFSRRLLRRYLIIEIPQANGKDAGEENEWFLVIPRWLRIAKEPGYWKDMPGQHLPTAFAQTQTRLLVASTADFETVTTLFAELHQYNASLDAHFSLAETWRDLLEEHFQRTCTLPSALWLLAWVDERPAGLLILENHLDSPLFHHHAWIELVALYVRAAYRGTGLAQHLMREAQLWAGKRGATYMQLYVTTTNEHARAFYRKCGWKAVQEIWRLEMQGQQGPMEPLDDPSCGTEAERRAEMLEYGHQLARETRHGSEQAYSSLAHRARTSDEKE